MKKSAMKGFLLLLLLLLVITFAGAGKRIKKKLPIRLWGNGSSFQKKNILQNIFSGKTAMCQNRRHCLTKMGRK